jgi:Gas vesicle synthesis protein GvpL/GvpF
MIYIYGVVGQGAVLPEMSGVFGGPLTCFSHEALTLVTEEVPAPVIDATLGEGARGNETMLHTAVLAHQAVLNALVAQADLLPFRFGTVVDDGAAAATLISEQQDMFTASLGKIAGNLEWGVKVIRAAEAPAAPEKLASGADYLRQLSAKKLAVTDKQADLATLCDAVAKSVYDTAHAVVPLPLRSSDAREQRLVNLACLIPRGQEAALSAAVNAAAQIVDAPATIEISGPWPPFSFAGGGA